MGSGGGYAQAAASALLKKTDLSAREIVETALGIAGDICVFTNHNQTIEEQDSPNKPLRPSRHGSFLLEVRQILCP
jgi:hypothetical protein